MTHYIKFHNNVCIDIDIEFFSKYEYRVYINGKGEEFILSNKNRGMFLKYLSNSKYDKVWKDE